MLHHFGRHGLVSLRREVLDRIAPIVGNDIDIDEALSLQCVSDVLVQGVKLFCTLINISLGDLARDFRERQLNGADLGRARDPLGAVRFWGVPGTLAEHIRCMQETDRGRPLWQEAIGPAVPGKGRATNEHCGADRVPR